MDSTSLKLDSSPLRETIRTTQPREETSRRRIRKRERGQQASVRPRVQPNPPSDTPMRLFVEEEAEPAFTPVYAAVKRTKSVFPNFLKGFSLELV